MSISASGCGLERSSIYFPLFSFTDTFLLSVIYLPHLGTVLWVLVPAARLTLSPGRVRHAVPIALTDEGILCGGGAAHRLNG